MTAVKSSFETLPFVSPSAIMDLVSAQNRCCNRSFARRALNQQTCKSKEGGSAGTFTRGAVTAAVIERAATTSPSFVEHRVPSSMAARASLGDRTPFSDKKASNPPGQGVM